MSIEQNLSKKILVFRFVAPSTSMIVVDSVGNFQTESFSASILPFPNCTFVHYEPAADIYQIRFGENSLQTMTDPQKTQIEAFVATLPEIMDLHFPCYDPNRSNLFQGTMSLSEAKSKNFVSVTEDCLFPVAKYDVDDHEWISIKAIITDSGRLIVDPDSYCELCVTFLSEDEWNEFPKQPENELNSNWRWDFELKEWVDIRTAQEMLSIYRNFVYSMFQKIEMIKYAEVGMEYFNIIHNPLYMSFMSDLRVFHLANPDLVDTFDSSLQNLSGEWKQKVSTVFDLVKTKIDSTSLTVATPEEYDALASENIKLDLLKFYNMLKLSYEHVVLNKYWSNLPESIVQNGNLTKEHIAQFTDIFKTWISTTYGPEFVD